jgi:hypothetical protein
MSKYVIKTFEPGFEEEQDEIEIKLGKKQPWFNLGLKSYFSDPRFDPESVLSCFKGNRMLGFLRSKLTNESQAVLIHERPAAYIQFPSVLSGHNEVADLLMEKIIDYYKLKGVKSIQVRVSTMWENSIQISEKWGFKPLKDFQLGYKKYYNYDLRNGIPNYTIKDVQPFDQKRDLSECLVEVANFFKIPKSMAKDWILKVNSQEDLISHLIIRNDNKIAGYCYAYPNEYNKDIAATSYINAINEDYVKQLIAKTIHNCIQMKHKFFLIDLLNDLLGYEDAVKSLGFKLAATFGIYEKITL